jgi:hypothetical protein
MFIVHVQMLDITGISCFSQSNCFVYLRMAENCQKSWYLKS